ncbi:DUF4189 domain-containing protein [Mycobacterium nebraskense]|uniref:DUF4189 domain-containing protein n=1 Tax=Mycobacterium nebraskense TaxID=244292 RepID=A0A0F5NC77_9MYCO|nr:DUF4189 domain-containing protein [Mycobacterium nebraskense]KKC04659.1 hypothetical protein WU83_12635 [Mycobacterium nebraskense]KLO40654.1 hypothetical protein ABW17_16350 [Mycobacterium nebraskense]MBI2697413.1 DUF4189 domain-containing protein [Mycobacterium nebraskense]MCV7121131.1 DUF4189 domain-containing protein [Mycobacterium nebraskense]ORW13269.1 hypothetical protein AWC17_21050 [Mycobacterium nebraskense]
MKKRALAVIAVGVAFAAPSIAHADNNAIAMAISDSTGHIDIADGAASPGAAEKAVMETCRKTISDCRLLASGQGGCVALVLNAAKSRYFGGWGPTREEAEAAALGRAPGGTIQQGHDHCAGEGSSQ